jgi:cyanophycinase
MIRGSLIAMVGSGEYLPPMEAVDRYLLGHLTDVAHVVCLPTAAGAEGAERIAYWSELGETYFARLGVEVESLPVIDKPSANDAGLAESIRQSNFIYLSGGKPDYLYRTLAHSLAWTAILEVLNKGGVLAGCSAGAMIMGERIPGIPRSHKAFGLLRGAVIMPHFDEIPAAMVNALRIWARGENTLLGIEGNTALVGSDEGYQVVGRGGVVVWNRQGKRRYTQGQSVNWPRPQSDQRPGE